jgi:hypothetical protein
MSIAKISGSIAALLAATGAYALAPTTATYDISLVVAGSSAFEPNFKAEFANICQAGTIDNFTASGSPAPGMSAYSCTTVPGAPLTDATIQNKNVIVYYRKEGGSAYGVAPIAKGLQIYRLLVNGSCAGASPTWTCPVTGWNFAAETGSGNIVKDTVELGVSDVEPAKFIGQNWPGGFFGAAPTAAQLALITNIKPIIGQVFAFYVNSGVGASPLNLNRSSVSAILQGLVSDWNSVPKADGSGFVSAASLPIKICNRDNGSGTRASAAFYANNYLCGGPGLATTGGLAVNASTGTELTCISGNAGAIGYATYQGATNPAGTSLVTLNALTPSVINAATGQYEFWYEATFNNGAALTGLDSNLANALTARVRDAANLPAANVNGLALADFNTPVTPVVDPIRAVAITTHGGNSCNQTYTVF